MVSGGTNPLAIPPMQTKHKLRCHTLEIERGIESAEQNTSRLQHVYRCTVYVTSAGVRFREAFRHDRTSNSPTHHLTTFLVDHLQVVFTVISRLVNKHHAVRLERQSRFWVLLRCLSNRTVVEQWNLNNVHAVTINVVV